MIISKFKEVLLYKRFFKSSYDSKKMKDFQQGLLLPLLKNSISKVKFYSDICARSKFDIEDIKSLDDFSKFPISLKKDKYDYAHKDLINSDYDINRLNQISTSGSTGQPFTTYFSSNDQFIRNLNTFFIYHRAGLGLFDKRAYFRNSLNIEFTPYLFQKIGLLRSIPFSIFKPVSELFEQIKEIKVQNLEGMPSLLNMLAMENVKQNRAIKLKTVFTFGESLPDEWRKNIEESFATKVCKFYGMSETGSFAYECPMKNGYHISPIFFVEIIKNGYRLGAGEEGDIVVTALKQEAMPYIRYNTKDVGSINYSPCQCGNHSPRLMNLRGRKHDLFVDKSGNQVSGQRFLIGTYFIDRIRQYELVQNIPGGIEIKIAVNPGVSRATLLKDVRARLVSLFGDAFDFEVEIVEDIVVRPSSKFCAIRSNVK